MGTAPHEAEHPVTVRPTTEVDTLQRLPYFIGISRETAGAQGLSLSLVVIPPGAEAEPHYHEGYETAIYVLEGEVETRYGPALEHAVTNRAGDFLYIPPGLPHTARNLSRDRPARALVARNDAEEQERVVPVPQPG